MNPLGNIIAWAWKDTVGSAAELLARYEAVLPILKGISLVVSLLFIAGTVYSIIQSRYHHLFSDRWMDRLGSKDVLARRMRRLWQEAVHGIQKSDNREGWVKAMKNAESIMQEGLKAKGYMATNDSDRAGMAREAGEMATLEDMHMARNAYAEAKEESNPFTHEQAIAALKAYKKVIRETGVMGEGKF